MGPFFPKKPPIQLTIDPEAAERIAERFQKITDDLRKAADEAAKKITDATKEFNKAAEKAKDAQRNKTGRW